MVTQLYHQLRDTGVARLFEGTDGYGAGEQRRDFVFVGDVVDVNLPFAGRPAAARRLQRRHRPEPELQRHRPDRSSSGSAGAGSSTSRSPTRSGASTRASPRPTSPALRAAGYDRPFTTPGRGHRPPDRGRVRQSDDGRRPDGRGGLRPIADLSNFAVSPGTEPDA